MSSVILTNERGEKIGLAESTDAHKGLGLLHQAFSVYVFRSRGEELLLQRRAEEKRLFSGLWTNTCCSHVKPVPVHVTPSSSESLIETAERRLQEEMGFSCPLLTAGSFVYRAEDPHGNGAEHEYDTVLVGILDDADVHAHPAEVSDWKWIHIADLTEELERSPDLFTPWFAQGLGIAQEHLCTHA
ncbi:isopentenyl-diphosphate Delta-isomerase [Candidatus Peregrinibacteria bacterium]|nr:isopentenyl-diphosphate Delta-isomerase [Candidatus Peregrinibacteria bacterium]